MQSPPFTHREMLGSRSLAAQGIALASVVALFSFIGPFGTYDSMGPLARAGYWTLAMGVNWLLCAAAITLALRLAGAVSRRRLSVAIGGAALVAAVPGTGVVFAAEALFRPGYAALGAVPTIYLAVAVLMLLIGHLAVAVRAGFREAFAARADASPAPAAPAAAPPPRFLDRLPPELGRDLVYLKMADHYVEAFTAAGSTLILMRFADAIAELDGLDGLRVHRSYWVARRHVAGTARRAGRTTLRLTGGHLVPVSRGRLAEVRAAGLA